MDCYACLLAQPSCFARDIDCGRAAAAAASRLLSPPPPGRYHCLNSLIMDTQTAFTHLAVTIGTSVNTEYNLMKLQHAFSTKELRSEIGVRADPRMVNRLASRMVGTGSSSSQLSRGASMTQAPGGQLQHHDQHQEGPSSANDLAMWDTRIHAKVWCRQLHILMGTGCLLSVGGLAVRPNSDLDLLLCGLQHYNCRLDLRFSTC